MGRPAGRERLKPLNEHKYRSIEGRKARMAPHAMEALDAYLDGMSYAEIAAVFDVHMATIRAVILNAALVRLMEQQSAQRIEDTTLAAPEVMSVASVDITVGHFVNDSQRRFWERYL